MASHNFYLFRATPEHVEFFFRTFPNFNPFEKSDVFFQLIRIIHVVFEQFATKLFDLSEDEFFFKKNQIFTVTYWVTVVTLLTYSWFLATL